MTPQEILKAHLSKTITLTDDEFSYFFSHLKPLSFKKGESIITEGDTVSCEYFVLNGCLKTYYVNDDQKMLILQFAMSTWWASDYNALYNDVKATVHVDCITDTDVLCLTSEDRERLCREIYQLEYFFRWRSNKGFVATQRRLLSFMNNDARHRYEELLNMYPQLYNIVPKHLIAAYLGVSRETLSRLYQS
ncbi:cAMP-binding domain of CRP or a regulatory subunit of cAMP-dependent protein kinases [Pedobacter westerhofensis]|uniref:cAMP-binding domain of CRP or a regulatory subunit of cAMP-dependent protein kinases n=1 Tax=Pedobacter westerhofensis TaxID=425512 RepID=A0A521AUY7_9SPHI|nr:Crp/Fnr family transcriptional regulator [Pedobacter westerhofensis]SMO38627.1 cAMP-binding domain of CRP or a regulatory subunit of cAMP-dependent protein kinases [Pedobacter westerhofensis]